MKFAIVFSQAERAYTGPELRPHFLLQEFELRGSALGAFVGPCEVKTEHLVDWEDRIEHDFIQAKSMVHFIGEFFGSSLREGVFAQRLLMGIIAQKLNTHPLLETQPMVLRDGDDLFINDQKLSVSIVTSSPVSQLLHAGINIDAEGAPVKAVGLKDLGFKTPEAVQDFVKDILNTFSQEWEDIEWACAKVRPVI